MLAGARCSITWSRISTAVRTGITSTPRGGGRCTGPGNQHHAGAARRGGFGQRVAHLAAGAVGDVAHRVERLLRGPGGDQHGLAFQVAASAQLRARWRRRSPPGRPGVPGRSCRRPGSRCSGSTMRCPRRRSVSRLACVAGCCHMLTFMAGASTTGPVKAR